MRSCGIINEAISGAAEKKKHACAPDPSEDKSGRGEFRALKKVFASCFSGWIDGMDYLGSVYCPNLKRSVQNINQQRLI